MLAESNSPKTATSHELTPNSSSGSSTNQAAAFSRQLAEYTDYETVLQDLYRWNIRSKEFICAQNPHSSAPASLKSSLQNMQAVASALGNPQDSYQIIHVAGTNGKGSVCLKTSVAMQAAGLRTGLFTSPHISCFRERMRIDG